jgi:hypothetical protein
MNLLDVLIVQRIYTILELLYERLRAYLEEELYSTLDVEKAVVEELCNFGVKLVSGFRLHIFETYAVENFQLVIARYNYALYEKEEPVLSCDNAPHHPGVRTFPHHKHRYPKDRFKPTAFSGQIEDVLEDVLWELNRRGIGAKGE